MKSTLAFLLALAASTSVLAQTAPPRSSAESHRNQAAFTYTWARSNAPVGSCACFSLNGGSAQFAVPIGKTRFFGVFDLSAITQGNVVSTGQSLTLTVVTGGMRWQSARGAWRPYAQALVGGAHASGQFAQTSIGPGNSTWSFAGNFGGGLDRRLGERWSFRLIEADYLLARFNNQSNNYQNIARISSGVVLRF